ncbi:hypothetical protein [Nostoc sp.]|uniref:hypothetical protein n=1 Tax=Nostoc sp. TaxID=1180 RepID=UPI002FF72802
MPTYLLLGASLINALIIITLLFEAALNKTACVGVARRRHRSSISPVWQLTVGNTTLVEHDCELLPWKT